MNIFGAFLEWFASVFARLRFVAQRLQELSHFVGEALEAYYQRKGVLRAGRTFQAPAMVKGDRESSFERYLVELNQQKHEMPTGISSALDPYEIQVGDIILVAPKEQHLRDSWEGLKFKQTYTTQLTLLHNLGIAEDQAKLHARYTHVAVCKNGHEVLESLPFVGVRLGSYWGYCDDDKYEIKVRRLKSSQNFERRFLPVANIEANLGNSYGFLELAALKARSINWRLLAKFLEWLGDDESYICSALYAEACKKEDIDLGFACENSEMITPAHLSLSNALEDVVITRLTIPQRIYR